MLVDTQYMTNTKKLVVSYVDGQGEIKLKYYPWVQPTKFEVCDYSDKDKHPTYKSWDKKPVKEVPTTYPNRYSVYEFLDALPEEEKEVIFEYNEPKIFFIDIETEVVDGFPDPLEAPTMIQSLSIVYDDKIILLGQKELDSATQKRIIDNTNEYFKDFNITYELKYIKYEDEFDMLYAFFNKMLPKMPLITGWNFVEFDWTFLVNRAKKISKVVNGKKYVIDPRVSSFTRKLDSVWGTDLEMPKHRCVFDYMQLYKTLDTSVKVKESNSLDFVSEKTLGVQKIKYSGSLMELYENDFEKFMYYNCVDSVLVQMIHRKMNYISIIYGISALSQIKIMDVYSHMNKSLGSLAITEGVLRNLFRNEEDVVLFKDKTKNNSGGVGISGGWVKHPTKGMNRYVACYDFASLYPMVQRQFFISPENFKGIQDSKDDTYLITPDGYRQEIDFEKDVVCINGSVFEKRKSPTLMMLEDVYSRRKSFKKIMMTKKNELDAKQKELESLLNELE